MDPRHLSRAWSLSMAGKIRSLHRQLLPTRNRNPIHPRPGRTSPQKVLHRRIYRPAKKSWHRIRRKIPFRVILLRAHFPGPKGTTENSPAIYRRGKKVPTARVPKGRLTITPAFQRPETKSKNKYG